MIAIGPRAHVEDGGHRAEIEFAIEVREQFVVARGLPAQGIAERVCVDGDQEQAGLAEIMLSRRFGDLGRGRKMNEAVAQIVRAAPLDALPLGLAPGRGGSDFINRAHGYPRFPCLSLSLLGFSRKWPGLRPTVKAAGRQLKRCRTGRCACLALIRQNRASISCFDALFTRTGTHPASSAGQAFAENATRDLRKPAE